MALACFAILGLLMYKLAPTFAYEAERRADISYAKDAMREIVKNHAQFGSVQYEVGHGKIVWIRVRATLESLDEIDTLRSLITDRLTEPGNFSIVWDIKIGKTSGTFVRTEYFHPWANRTKR